jgi:N-acyl-D-aspartate/D-glutamate deacylase
MSNLFVRLCALVAMTAATPGLATAQTVAYGTKSPIVITSFNVNKSLAGTNNEEPPQYVVSTFALKFVNKSDVLATTVAFSVNDGEFTQTIVDKGSFAPGVEIRHAFEVNGVINALPNAACNVTEVDFADGSIWHIAGGDFANR